MRKLFSRTYQVKAENQTYLLREQYKDNISHPENLEAYPDTCMVLQPTSRMELDGKLVLNDISFDDYHRSTILRMDSDAVLRVTGDTFKVCYGGNITVYSGAELVLGNSFMNIDSKIMCRKKITIGDDCAIAQGVTIMDTDFHRIIVDGVPNEEVVKEIHIGNHVWICEGVSVLKGVTIGDGAVIAAGAVVTRDIPPRTLAAGCPAKVIKENVTWEK